MEDNQTKTNSGLGTVGQIILRFIASAIILAITAFFTPGFTISNVWALALGAIVLTVMDYLIVKFTGLDANPFGKGFVRIYISCSYTISYTIFCCRL